VLLRQRAAEQQKVKSSGRETTFRESLPETDTTLPAMRMTMKSRHNFLEATPLGQVSFPDVIRHCKNMCDMAAGVGLWKILFDCGGLEGELAADERFDLGKPPQRALSEVPANAHGSSRRLTSCRYGIRCSYRFRPGIASRDFRGSTNSRGVADVSAIARAHYCFGSTRHRATPRHCPAVSPTHRRFR
jgi:hypothetical protein